MGRDVASQGPITFIVWKWFSPTYRTTFEASYVNIFAGMLRRYYQHPHRLVCITDNPDGVECETFPIWKDHDAVPNACGAVLPSCYRRLKIFDLATTRALGIEDGSRVVSFDLDAIMLGDLTPLFDREDAPQFVGWKGIGTFRPVVYNGSLFMFRAGALQWMWDEFDPVLSPQQTREARYYGSDQAWMSLRLNGSAPGWDVEDGVFSYARDIYLKGLPPDPRIIFFNGKRKPWEPKTQIASPWIAQHWRA